MKKNATISMVLVLCISVATLLIFSALEGEEAMGSIDKDTVFLYAGSPLMLSGDKVSFLDPDDFGAAVYMVGKKAYIPPAASKEIFGKEYTYDENEKSFIKVNGRVLIALSELAGKVFDAHLNYKGDVIAISKEAKTISKEQIARVEAKIGGATKAKSEAQLKKIMKEPLLYGIKGMLRDGIQGVMPTFFNGGDMATADMEAGGDSSVNYSETNVQVAGIDEADIIKTDGRYIYYCGDASVKIFKAESRGLSLISEITGYVAKNIREMFLDGDRLVLLGNRYEIYGEYRNFAFADVYDVSDPASPRLKKSHEMEGVYAHSRKKGEHVYLVTNTGGWYIGQPRPYFYDSPLSEDNKHRPMEIDDIMVMPEPVPQGYIVVSAINIEDDSTTEMEAITAYGQEMYMNAEALYITSSINDETVIHKFVIDGMKIGYGGSEKVKGHLLNQFSMDEYEGNLRIATTEWEKGNNLFILDSSLNEIGAVTGFAPGERIYSVRFMGDKGYVVTFRNMDPLFVFDLSDPQNPRITGELKIPGFSDYLHPVAENIILGIGKETNELIERYPDGTEEIVGYREGGLKVSLFDVSDMGKPKEITNLVIGKAGSNSEANYNHKAVMLDPARQQVGFYAQITRDKDWTNIENGALIVSYENNKLDLKALLKVKEGEDPYYFYNGFYNNRVIFIGDILYVFAGDTIGAYDYNSFEQISELKIM